MDQLPVILKKARQALDLSQADVAKRLGISQRAYAFYEDEERTKIPKAKRLADLGRILNIPIQSLLKHYNAEMEAEIEAETSNLESKDAVEKGLKQRIINTGVSRDNSTEPRSDHAAYIQLLEDNDRFFKTEYHNLLLSLKELVAQGQRAERLIKLNLQHIGTVEALQKGIDEDEIQAQIGSQIAGAGED